MWFGNPVLDPTLFTSCYAVQLDGFVQISPPTIQVCPYLTLKLRNECRIRDLTLHSIHSRDWPQLHLFESPA